MNVEEGQGLRNQRSDKNRFQAWMTLGGNTLCLENREAV